MTENSSTFFSESLDYPERSPTHLDDHSRWLHSSKDRRITPEFELSSQVSEVSRDEEEFPTPRRPRYLKTERRLKKRRQHYEH